MNNPEQGQVEAPETFFDNALESLRNTRIGNMIAAGSIALTGAIAANVAQGIINPDKAEAAMECTTTTTTSPDGNTTTTRTECIDNSDSSDEEHSRPEAEESPDDPGEARNGRTHREQVQARQEARQERRQARHNNLLPVPEKRTRRHWATKIINEVRKGRRGRINASPQAKKDLYQARRGQCSRAEQKPSACPKLDKTLLKVLYRASHYRRFYIWHFTSGPHVPTSHHWNGDATDLRRYNGKAPQNKSMFPIIRRVTPRNKSLELVGPGDDKNHTGRKNGHWHIAIH